jgi:hypothetical protein
MTVATEREKFSSFFVQKNVFTPEPDGVTTPSDAMPDGKWNDLRSLKNAL